MTASTRSRRTLLFASIAIGAPSIGVAVACGGGDTHGVVSGGGGETHDSGTVTKFDANGPHPDASGDDGAALPDSPTGSDVAVDAFDSGPPDAGPPLCDPKAAAQGDAGALVLSTGDPDLMGGISDDELVIAWTRVPSGGAPAVYWAERAAVGDPFGTPQPLDAKFGPWAPDHVALRGDGLRLVVVSADRTHVLEIGRTARGAPFDTDTTGDDFNGVNPTTEGNQTNPGMSPFGSPSLASSFKSTWAFVQVGAAGFVVAQSQAGTWSTPFLPAGLVPPGSGAQTMIPTGWSADGRTLFYWDATGNVERAAWRDPFSLDFIATHDVGSLERYAVPSASCGRLYYSAPGAGGDLDLFAIGYQ